MSPNNLTYTGGAELWSCPWVPCDVCDDYLLEAWERQTRHGLGGNQEDRISRRVLYESGHVTYAELGVPCS